MSFLGVDIGGTASRFVLADAAGTILARGAAGGATGHIFNPVERDKLVAVLQSIAAALPPGTTLVSACLGITGLGDKIRDEAATLIGSHLALPAAAIRLTDDMELAYRAAFAPGAGHLISAGTGSIGLHVAIDGRIIRVGGRGLLIDDGGSGTWIALTALDRLYRGIDETGSTAGAQILADELFAAMGGDDWDATRAYVYGSDRGRIGALAQAVARAADQGDALALDILTQAGAELARLGRALVQRAGHRPIGYVGGIIDLHPAIRTSLAAALPGETLLYPRLDAAAFAAQWARG
ncbi:N-acetylglucosamine kinase [Devosia yakushimensis]|uniref:N-acetylglucosamine kinase n=1 Tax=Devosia yakushimensis TaxID=470028 RepID=A0ABQ5UFX6_9HYPH|nr:BadF/BadG/BcrA/BcrD ATPase family protein [Devosia yakushimensis]GLQ10997.1 N-acetylglucosamine kinase [Devosia yakushimensis]